MNRNYFLLFLATFLLSSCKTSEIILPDSLYQSTTSYDVTRKVSWKSAVSFGEYAAQETKKSIPQSSSSEIFGFTKGKAKHDFEFKIKNSQTSQEFSAEASNFLKTKGFNIRGLFPEDLPIMTDAEDLFRGQIKLGDEEWNFFITDSQSGAFYEAQGFLSDGENYIEIQEITDLEQKGWDPSETRQSIAFGYEFRNENGKVLGAVRAYNKGKVWFKNGISQKEKDLLSTLSAALLLKVDA